MKRLFKRFRRQIAIALLGLGLIVVPAYDQPARAQEPDVPAEPGSGSGRPFDGYMGTVVIVLLAFFIVGKSARR